MSAEAMSSTKSRIPAWVWLVIVALSIIEPAQHVWLRYAAPEGAAPTGLHIPDDAIFLQAMRMFDNGFFSPYASYKAASANSPAYFALPYLWFYGVLGSAGRAVGLDDFITLGIVNGLGAFAYLLVVFCFLREIAPRHANLSFAIFSLGGGLGGVAYLVTAVSGMHLWPGFEEYFRRFALYELLEGPYLSPAMCLPRVYYTASLALGLGGFTALVRGLRTECLQHLGFALLLLAGSTLVNMRVGVFVTAIVAMYMIWGSGLNVQTLTWGALSFVVVGAACVVTLRVAHMSPVMESNVAYSGGMAMWLSPFLTGSVFVLIPAGYRVTRAIGGLQNGAGPIALALSGYLIAFCALFAAYQAYYGNLLICRDGVVAVAISDWALVGAVAGAVISLAWNGPRSTVRDPDGWIELWFLLFLFASVSAFGHGWFLRFGPQRLMVLIGLPMSILAAQGLEMLRPTRPRLVRSLVVLILSCGATSIVVSSLFFQGAAGWLPAGAFAWAKPGLITRADRAAMERTPAGRVLAPPLAADVLALGAGHTVVFGIGSFNLTEQPYGLLESGVHRFYSKTADESFRKQFVREWGVRYVFCSDTWRVDPAVIEQLRQTPWLRLLYASGMATVFEVVGESDKVMRHGN